MSLMQSPIHLLKGINQLTTESLEKKLRQEENSLFSVTKSWTQEVRDNGLFVDLSQVRWVNLGTATLLVLFVEAAVKENIQIFIALPIKRLTNDDKP